MYDARNRPTTERGPDGPSAIPAEQFRALDRRHALDQQQNGFRSAGRRPQPPTSRRPA